MEILAAVCLISAPALSGCASAKAGSAGSSPKTTAMHSSLVPAGEGFSQTSVNTAVFRGSSVATHGDTQYISYYDKDGYVVIGKRQLGSDEWTLRRSQYKGNIGDGHNVISIGVDGDGYLHVSFDHHGHPLRYAMAEEPGSLVLGPKRHMTGAGEDDVTYPEFYTMPDGNMIFAYRSGASGRGNLVLNRYVTKEKRWERIHDVLIDGEDARNAYWQMYVDPKGVIHLSWVWRETWMVETNHDLCYARSLDGGHTWQRSDGSRYSLPITLATAEKAWEIPQKSELINQTSMTADSEGHPYIATYWRDSDSDVPQYRLVWHDGKKWNMNTVGHRTTPFSLAGGGHQDDSHIASAYRQRWTQGILYIPRHGARQQGQRGLHAASRQRGLERDRCDRFLCRCMGTVVRHQSMEQASPSERLRADHPSGRRRENCRRRRDLLPRLHPRTRLNPHLLN